MKAITIVYIEVDSTIEIAKPLQRHALESAVCGFSPAIQMQDCQILLRLSLSTYLLPYLGDKKTQRLYLCTERDAHKSSE